MPLLYPSIAQVLHQKAVYGTENSMHFTGFNSWHHQSKASFFIDRRGLFSEKNWEYHRRCLLINWSSFTNSGLDTYVLWFHIITSRSTYKKCQHEILHCNSYRLQLAIMQRPYTSHDTTMSYHHATLFHDGTKYGLLIDMFMWMLGVLQCTSWGRWVQKEVQNLYNPTLSLAALSTPLKGRGWVLLPTPNNALS